MSKRLDPFGVFIVAFVASVGGGTLRDVLVGRDPVFWMTHPIYVYVIAAGAIVAVVFRKKMNYLRTTLSLFDTIGLAVFTIIGIEVGSELNLEPIIIVALGVMTGSFGGVIRDILVNEIPVIFQKEIYVTASVAGGLFYLGGEYFNLEKVWNQLFSVIIIISFRLLAVKYKLSLPTFYNDNN